MRVNCQLYPHHLAALNITVLLNLRFSLAQTICESWSFSLFHHGVVDLLLNVTPVVGVLIVVCFVARYFMSICVLQSF